MFYKKNTMCNVPPAIQQHQQKKAKNGLKLYKLGLCDKKNADQV